MNERNFDPRRTVLIGDTSKERFQLLEKILRDDFHLQARRLTNFTDLWSEVEAKNNWRLALIADDLHESTVQRDATPLRYFYLLGHGPVPLGCLVSGKLSLDLKALKPQPHYLRVPRTPAIDDLTLHNEIIIGLRSFGWVLPDPIHLPNLQFSEDDRTLREQIRGLSEHRSRNEGEEILRHLIRWFFDDNKVWLERLGQGLSGAKVFLLRLGDGEETKSYVLKLGLGTEDNLWKLEKEVEKHEQAMPRMGAWPYQVHLPLLHPCLDSAPAEFIACYKGWAAVCYDYLGNSDRKGGIIDLETLLICSREDLSAKTTDTAFYRTHLADGAPLAERREQILDEFIAWLCQEWYQKDGKVKRADKTMWLTKDCLPKEYPDLPPYQLKGKEKGWILDFLDSKDAEKVAQLLPDWNAHREKVGEFVEKNGELTGIAVLDEPISVILSPAHGDLNANNAMLWLEHVDHRFLIDFPFFQEAGHALQDFARLEIEIIYALMECQAENSAMLPASDHTHTQLPLWRQLIDHLLDEDKWKEKKQWGDGEFTGNIEHCLDLIQRLRQKAETVQAWQDKPTDHRPGFFAEYLPALLYYTLREIGYPSRTVFKRLLAVYSASQILTQLG